MWLNSHLNKPVYNVNLELFRIVFGIVAFTEGAGALVLGWVKETFVEIDYNFTFIGFEWLNHLNGPYMYVHYVLIALFGLGIATGTFYRVSATGFLLFWTTSYLMQKHHYNNHYYLMILLGLWMCILPVGKRFSVDVFLGRTAKENFVPAWALYALIVQLGIVYFYAAIAKLYPDWLHGLPLTIWLTNISKSHIFGEALASRDLILFLAYTGIVYDFLVVPALLFKKTRWFAVVASLLFHLFNSIVFQIGTFPYMMIGALILFFPPEQVENWLSGNHQKVISARKYALSSTGKFMLLAFFIIQIVLPLRHWFYKDSVNWTEEGHRMSWRMMLRTKSGSISFQCKNPETGEVWMVDPSESGLTQEQKSVMAKSPDMIWQFVQKLKQEYEKNERIQVEVYAHCMVSLNGRPYQQFVDPTVNLAEQPWKAFAHAEWILPYAE